MGPWAKTFRLSRVPLYIQLATTLRRRIEEGHWTPGAQISTLEELQEEFEVARVTARQAVDLLQKEGWVRRQQGKGTFVAEGAGDRRWLKLNTTWSSLIETIKGNVPKFLPVSLPVRPPKLNFGDGVPAKDYVYMRSLQSRHRHPYSLVSLHIAEDVFKQDPYGFRTRTALPIVASLPNIQIARARQTLVIGTADPETARLLEVPLNAPTAEAHCVVTNRKGVAIYVADIIYRGDCISIETDLLEPSQLVASSDEGTADPSLKIP
ncbi:MAG TPA: GntR family transcriptional regulator [Alphaproteobacteria bacterium]|nr:GntR family transcriptional regulator [Alphaproteobacteria bacterium]